MGGNWGLGPLRTNIPDKSLGREPITVSSSSMISECTGAKLPSRKGLTAVVVMVFASGLLFRSAELYRLSLLAYQENKESLLNEP
jgi:hypothetical protein